MAAAIARKAAVVNPVKRSTNLASIAESHGSFRGGEAKFEARKAFAAGTVGSWWVGVQTLASQDLSACCVSHENPMHKRALSADRRAFHRKRTDLKAQELSLE
eukprot:6123802-Amphidinium_carterae.1